MCRFLVYKGKDEILLSKLILDPTHSILTQSFDSRLRLDTRRPHNGDGFGVGYYTSPSLGPEPCIFTSTIPAWNCINLERLASKTTSSLIFAHVRATTEGNLSDSNCHPFRHGQLMWMHNGGIGSWKHVKRRLATSVADEWFNFVQGSTDSEWAFALFLDSMERMGHSPNAEPGESGFGHTALRKAMLKTIERINGFIAEIPDRLKTEEDSRSLLNFAVTDGHSVVCTRYVSSRTDEAASLFFSSGTSWKQQKPSGPSDDEKGDYKMERRDKGADIVLVASEPLTFERDNWVTVPTNSTLTIHKQTVMIHPIIDEFYSYNPSHSRSSQFARTKGQTVTGADKKVLSQTSTQEPSGAATPVSGFGLAEANDPREKLEVLRSALGRARLGDA
ncbi:glucosamine 6-phosphate synthetase [Coniosporium apollinis CBS 100218]|uniref:Glucosamine 6-phosphate synthetase n=1 Tax=Coniosporium apollinis (strain CBS 100218) TaxID=1168221 RepID=R7Z754_CONA1|nr:glucosamine 6-phosphate synthetase [Coniosporium apollinis CBS 100218]EON70010.1 glucosamine 6-phosphate synthetase [Coniosporium apollinis CBS 100218]